MFTRVARYRNGVTGRSAHTGDFVCRDCTSYTRTVNDDSHIYRSVGNCPGNGMSKVGIVDGIFGIGAKIVDAMTGPFQKSLEFLFHSESAVVSPYGNNP